MKSLNIPIIMHKHCTLEQIELKENKVHNRICAREMQRITKQFAPKKNTDLIFIITESKLFLKRNKSRK